MNRIGGVQEVHSSVLVHVHDLLLDDLRDRVRYVGGLQLLEVCVVLQGCSI
jgi:hypothetical protein